MKRGGDGGAPSGSLFSVQECELADDIVTLRQQELNNEKHLRDLQEIKVALLDEKLKIVRNEVSFSAKDLSDVLAQLDKHRTDLTLDQQSLERQAAFYDRVWAESRMESPSPSLLHDAELAAGLAARRNVDRQLRLIDQQLERLSQMRSVWQRRYRVASEHLGMKIYEDWSEEAEAAIVRTVGDINLQERQISDLRQAVAKLEQQIKAEESEEEPIVRWLQDELRQQQESIEALSRDIASQREYKQLHEKLLREIDDRTQSFSLVEWANYATDQAHAVWKHELFASEDRSITLGQLCKCILLLSLALFFSRRASRLIGKRLLPRLGVNEGAAAALQSLAFYGLLVTCSLTALHIVSVPLTMFTFLGGAFAIGLGFGSQKIINNFVSGLILLIERPIRTGDLIEVDGLSGVVENIGMRSTRVCTATNVEITVPNSSFLENNVVNWTLSDVMIRACVPVGVAYGSPTREVARHLKRAAEEHGLVLPKPEPFVWFTDFGDNALQFELHFYLNMRNLSERKRIQSDLRFMIEQYFGDAGIVIAFPQRDIHIDTQKAIDVRVLPNPDDNVVVKAA